MADIPGLIAGLAICPDAVTPAADKQLLQCAIRNLVGISDADRICWNRKVRCLSIELRTGVPLHLIHLSLIVYYMKLS